MWYIAGEARTNSLVTFFNGPLHMDASVLANLQELIYISWVRTQEGVRMICLEGWMIGMDWGGERESQENLCWQQNLMMMMMYRSAIGVIYNPCRSGQEKRKEGILKENLKGWEMIGSNMRRQFEKKKKRNEGILEENSKNEKRNEGILKENSKNEKRNEGILEEKSKSEKEKKEYWKKNQRTRKEMKKYVEFGDRKWRKKTTLMIQCKNDFEVTKNCAIIPCPLESFKTWRRRECAHMYMKL